MSPELSCAKRNGGNGNGNTSHEIDKPKPSVLPKENTWGIRRDMPRLPKKEPRKKPLP